MNKNNEQLFHAARTGNIELLGKTIGRGVDIHTHNQNGQTAMHVAAEYNQSEVMTFLRGQHADMNIKDLYDRRPIHAAIEFGSTKAIAFLAANGIDLHELYDIEINGLSFGETNALHYAALCGESASVNTLIELGCDVNEQSSIGWSAIHYAVAFADEPKEVIATLLARGSDVNAKTRDGRTLLHMVKEMEEVNGGGLFQDLDQDAMRQRALDEIDILLEAGADPLIVDKKGVRPIVENGTTEELSKIDQHILGCTGAPVHSSRRIM